MTQTTPHAREFAGESWDPAQYLKFSDHRLRPALDLIERVPRAAPGRIYDLGCGSGHITRMLADRWPVATVVGMDNSPQMLAKARATPSRVQWEQGDLEDWRPAEAPSLLFSNAAIQWLPDHGALIPRLWSLLPAGGCLAVQAPLSWDQPSHRLMRETLADGGADGSALGSAELRQAVGNRWLHEPGAGMGHRHQPAPDPERPRRPRPRHLPQCVPPAAPARLPAARRRHHPVPVPPPVLRRRTSLSSVPPGPEPSWRPLDGARRTDRWPALA